MKLKDLELTNSDGACVLDIYPSRKTGMYSKEWLKNMRDKYNLDLDDNEVAISAMALRVAYLNIVWTQTAGVVQELSKYFP